MMKLKKAKGWLKLSLTTNHRIIDWFLAKALEQQFFTT
jgi:hypothetical protein